MNNQLPFFMPMYPNNNQQNNMLEQKISMIKDRLENLEQRVRELERTKVTKIQNNKNNYDNFKEGYII